MGLVVVAAMLFCGVMVGLMVLANEASKDSRPSASGNLKTIDGKSVKTDSITTKSSMADLALVPLESLKTLKNLAVKVDMPMPDGNVYEATQFYTITGFTHMAAINLVSLHTSRGDTLIVDNGKVTVLEKDGKIMNVKAKRRRSLLAPGEDEDDGFSANMGSGDVKMPATTPDGYGKPFFSVDDYKYLTNDSPTMPSGDSSSDNSDSNGSDSDHHIPDDVPEELRHCFEMGYQEGEQLCEGHEYDETMCHDDATTGGCCHFDHMDGQCMYGAHMPHDGSDSNSDGNSDSNSA